jgi:hypothetical protein
MKQVALAACLLQRNTAHGAQALFARCFVVSKRQTEANIKVAERPEDWIGMPVSDVPLDL